VAFASVHLEFLTTCPVVIVSIHCRLGLTAHFRCSFGRMHTRIHHTHIRHTLSKVELKLRSNQWTMCDWTEDCIVCQNGSSRHSAGCQSCIFSCLLQRQERSPFVNWFSQKLRPTRPRGNRSPWLQHTCMWWIVNPILVWFTGLLPLLNWKYLFIESVKYKFESIFFVIFKTVIDQIYKVTIFFDLAKYSKSTHNKVKPCWEQNLICQPKSQAIPKSHLAWPPPPTIETPAAFSAHPILEDR
jgi:hypothetical protein